VLLDEVMQPLGVSRAQLARDIDVPIDRLRAVIIGRLGISADMALRLGRHFGTSAELWMKLQSDYDLATARAGSWRQLERRIRVFGGTPADPSASVATGPPPERHVEPPPPEAAENAANENLAMPVAEPEQTEPDAPLPDGLAGEEEQPLDLTELVEAVDPEPDHRRGDIAIPDRQTPEAPFPTVGPPT
jgi:addiction module HigA family antidote